MSTYEELKEATEESTRRGSPMTDILMIRWQMQQARELRNIREALERMELRCRAVAIVEASQRRDHSQGG